MTLMLACFFLDPDPRMLIRADPDPHRWLPVLGHSWKWQITGTGNLFKKQSFSVKYRYLF